MNTERGKLIPEAVLSFEKFFQDKDHATAWREIISTELQILNSENSLLAYSIEGSLEFASTILDPFDKSAYLMGVLGSHKILRAAGLYTRVLPNAIENYITDLQKKLRGQEVDGYLIEMENDIEKLVPGGLSAIDSKLSVINLVKLDKVIIGIHRPEMIFGAADVILPMAYELGMLPASKN